jgi:hypothetical protein
MSRVYSRLIELGVLTPEEGFDVFQSGRLPTSEESIESQKRYKDLKEKGYYQPLIGGVKDASEGKSAGSSGGSKNPAGNSGRPSGTGGVKQSVPRRQASGSSNLENLNQFSCDKIKVTISSLTLLEKKIESILRAKFKIKKLNKEQVEVASDMAILIAQNEELAEWGDICESYVEDPSKTNQEVYNKIDELAIGHNLDNRSACILYHSRK